MGNEGLKFNRILAALIDGFVMLVLFLAICIMPAITVIRDIISERFIVGDILWLAFSVIGSFFVWILYLFFTGIIFRNATLGMKITKICFVKSNGMLMTFKTILFREIVVVFSIVFSLGFSLIFDPISLICSENCKNFYDIFSSTKVVGVDAI